jgi:hypothetical protein
MNTLAFLLLTTLTPGADPVPVISSQPAPLPGYGNYGATEWSNPSQESRPRFFGRLRNLFSRKSQGMDSRVTESTANYPYQMTGNGTMSGTVFTPSPISTPSTPVPSPNTTSIRSQPVFTPSSGSSLQRMPTGQPSTSGQPF